jgi:hypothetical protein
MAMTYASKRLPEELPSRRAGSWKKQILFSAAAEMM